MKYDAFISYRRDGGIQTARLIKELLENREKKVFLDVDELRGGRFNMQLLDHISNSLNFILILSLGALDRCNQKNDWLTIEISHALEKKRNIIPVFMEGFAPPKPEELPDNIRELLQYNGVLWNHQYFPAFKTELINRIISESGSENTEENKASVLSNEERIVRSDDLYKNGRNHELKGRLGWAIDCLETSVRYNPKAERYYYLAELYLKNGDHQLAIEALNKSINLDKSNKKAMELLQQIQSITLEEKLTENVFKKDKKRILYPTIMHASAPSIFSDKPILWAVSVVVGFYSISSLLDIFLGLGVSGVVKTIRHGLSPFLFAILPIVARGILIRIEPILFRQLDKGMKEDKWKKYYQTHMENMFGKFIIDESGKIQLFTSIWKEKFYYLIWFLYIIIGVSSFLSGSLNNYSCIYIIKTSVAIAFMSLIVPCFRYVLFSTKFLYDFSQLSLKPMLTKINDEGLSSLGNLIVLNTILATLANFFYWIVTPHEFTKVILIFLIFFSLATYFWIIAMPSMLQRAAREAKTKAIETFSQHIEQSFNRFLESPDEKTFKQYQWLLKHQKIFVEISTWPLSWQQTLFFIIGSFILITIILIFFILSGIGKLDIVYKIIAGFIGKLF